MKRLFLLALIAGFSAFGQDALTVETAGGQLSKIDWTWTSDGSGNASGVSTTVVPGVLYSISTTPSTSAVPTDNYDIVVQNQVTGTDGSAVVLATDRAGGLVANRDNVNTELVEFWPSGVYTTQGRIKISVSNAGASKSGRIVITFHRNLAVMSSGGSFGVPLGGATTQLLQWSTNGQAKWITSSGDVSYADGGAATVSGDALLDASTVNIGPADDSGTVNINGLTYFRKTPIYFDTTENGTGTAIFIMGPAGTNRHFGRLFSGNNETTGKRWDFYANSDLETGGDAGSNIKFGAYDDSGNFIDNVFEIWRAAHGEIKFGNNGRDIRLGDDTLARDVAFRFESAAGQNRFIAFQTAGQNRFTTGVNDTAESGSNAGSDWFLKALADNGADIDFPIIVRRVAGGDIDITRRIDSSAGALFTTINTSGDTTLGDGTGDSHTINGSMIGSQTSTGSTVWANYNTNTGTAAFAQTVVGNTAATTDAVSMLCLSTGYTTSGAFKQDGGAFAANANLSGGLSILARESSADVRVYAGGSADGDLVATFDDAQLATFEGAVSIKGNTTLGDASTDTITLTAQTLLTSVTDAGPMTATAGTERQIVYNESDSKVYICTVTGSPATWAALN